MNKELLSEIYKQLIQLNFKRIHLFVLRVGETEKTA